MQMNAKRGPKETENPEHAPRLRLVYKDIGQRRTSLVLQSPVV